MPKNKTFLFLAIWVLQSAPGLFADDPEGDDTYFQEVTTQAWREEDQRKKAQLQLGVAELADPREVSEKLAQARRFEELGAYKKAAKAYEKALSYSPPYPAAAEILWNLGRCYEELWRFQDAFEAYRLLARDYPGFDHAEEALDRQLQMAITLADGKKKAVLSGATDKTRQEIAVEMLKKLERQGDNPSLGAVCRYESGKIYKAAGKYLEASNTFYEVVLNYPQHPLYKEALYESGICGSALVRKADYDEELVDAVLSRLSRFVEENPEDSRAAGARDLCSKMKEMKAEKLYQTARFYQKSGSPSSARLYFNRLIETYPKTTWAERARHQKPVSNN